MTERWQEEKDWSDIFLHECMRILGPACLAEAPIDEDRKHNTDLMFDASRGRHAVRIRRVEQRLPYNRRNEITFRLSMPSGAETELEKLLEGWGDLLLYGWGDERARRIAAYTVVNLHKLRRWVVGYCLHYKRLPGMVQPDRDGSAEFLALCLDCLPAEVLIERHTALPRDTPITGDQHWLAAHHPLSGRAKPAVMPRLWPLAS
jgi:hypothetical protein